MSEENLETQIDESTEVAESSVDSNGYEKDDIRSHIAAELDKLEAAEAEKAESQKGERQSPAREARRPLEAPERSVSPTLADGLRGPQVHPRAGPSGCGGASWWKRQH